MKLCEPNIANLHCPSLPRHYKTSRLLAGIILSLVLSLYLHQANASASENVSRINSSIRVSGEESTGKLSTVNGSILIARSARVNGSVSTVNGAVRINDNALITESVSTVNGSINMAPGSVVHGSISNVNGSINLDNAKVDGDIRTTNGNISISGASAVSGDIIIRNNSRRWTNLFSRNRSVTLSIDPASSVNGDIYLHDKVKLIIDDYSNIHGRIIHHGRRR